MPQFDNRKAAQVWQRVHAAPEVPAQESANILALLPPLQACIQSCAGHRDLSASFRRQAAVLAGIHTLMTGADAARTASHRPQNRTSPGAPNAGTLRKCYLTQCRCLSQYQALCGHPDYGPAFQAMIPLAQETCLTILSLLGS